MLEPHKNPGTQSQGLFSGVQDWGSELAKNFSRKGKTTAEDIIYGGEKNKIKSVGQSLAFHTEMMNLISPEGMALINTNVKC